MEKQTAAQPATAKGQGAFEWYEALISAALVLVLVFSFFFRIIQVDGASMVPTLQNGDKLIVWGAGYEPRRGDVVIVDSYTAYGKPLVKRVIAKGGDTIRIDYSTGAVTTLPMHLQQFVERFNKLYASVGVSTGGSLNESIRLAGTLLTILPLIVLYFIVQKQFVESIERTGLTGE